MPQIPIIFGSGLDRETGVMAMAPGGMEDLRNVHLLTGKFQVRRGFERVMEFVDDDDNEQTDTLGGIAMLGRRAAVYVTYDSVNYKVNVFVGDADASWYSHLGEWEFLKEDDSAILTANNSDPPVIILAEYNNKVFMAHSTNMVDWRAQTHYVYYDEDDAEYKLEALYAEWPDSHDVVSDMKVRFRGVVHHLEYIIGWGWGTTEEDRPEFVRVSKPGMPLTALRNGDAFDINHYWIPGDEGDPVIACCPTAHTLLCFKESETWELYGTSYLNFGQRPIDAIFGMLQPRLAVNVEGAVFAWTTEGPRLFAPDGTSEALEIPLELYLPEPYDLITKGEDQYAFAVYMPVYRSVWFVFGRRVYTVYIRVPGDWKWGYQELGFDAMCGFRLPQSGWGLVEPPTGYPSSPTMNDIEDEQADVVVTNNGQDGDETLQVWLKPAGGEWALHKSFSVTTAATQEHTLENLEAGWDYDLAVRYKRGPFYSPAHPGTDPDTWPSSSKTSFTTTLDTLPTIDAGVWSRVSGSVEQVTLTITPPYTGTGYDVQIRRGGGLIDTEEDVSGSFDYDDTGCSGEASNSYDIRLVTPYVNGSYTAATAVWGGPPAPTATACDPVVAAETYEVAWANGMSAQVEIYDSLPAELEGNATDNLRSTEQPEDSPAEIGPITGSSGKQPWIAIRHKKTTYSVTDYSDWDTIWCSGTLN